MTTNSFYISKLIFFIQVAPALSKLIQSDRMWNDITMLIRSVYPALLLLRLADFKSAAMDKLYFYVRQMDLIMNRSKELLQEMETNYISASNNKFSYNKMIQYFLQTTEISDYCNEFKNLDEEPEDDESINSDNEEQEQEDLDDSDSDDETIDEEKPEVTLGERVKLRWDHRKKKLIHDLSIAAWMLSPVPDIMSDAYSSHDGEHRNAVERILKRWILDEEVNLFAVLLTYIFCTII